MPESAAGSRARRRRPPPTRGPNPSTPCRDRRRRSRPRKSAQRQMRRCRRQRSWTVRSAAWAAAPARRGPPRALFLSDASCVCELARDLANKEHVRLSAPPSRSRRKKVPAQRACTHGADARTTRRSRSPHAAAGRLRLGDCPRRQQGVPSQGLLALLGLRHEPDVQVRLSWQRLVHVCQDGLLGGAGLHVRRSERRHTGARAHCIS